MSQSEPAKKVKKNRKRPVYNKVRQMDWLLWRLVSEHKCCFCDDLLMEGFDPKKVNITIHHLSGSVKTDNRDERCPIDEQLYAHSSCHKAYHQMERLAANGSNIDLQRFNKFERNVTKHSKRALKAM